MEEQGRCVQSLIRVLNHRNSTERLENSAGDGGDEHDLVTVLELVGIAAEEADVLVVDVDVDETAELAVLVLDVLGEGGELRVELGEQAGEIGGFGVEGLLAVGVAGEGGGGERLSRSLGASCED